MVTVVAIVLFVSEWISSDATALLVATTLMVFGVVTPEEGLSGFSNVGTISVFCLLILSIGLQSTGVVSYIGDLMQKYAKMGETRMITFLSFLTGIFSAFLNNTAIVAIMLPVVIRLAQSSKINPSKLLMPLSFAAMVGGTMTIIGTSTNVIVAAIYEEEFGASFGIFEFSFFGLMIFAVYMIYMLTLGRFILPERKREGALTEEYNIDDYLMQVTVLSNSKMIGKPISETDLVQRYNVKVLELIREGDKEVWVPGEEKLRAGDQLIVKTSLKQLVETLRRLGLRVAKGKTIDEQDLTSEQAVLFEAVLGYNSSLIGKKVSEVDFLDKFQTVPLAVRRSGQSLSKKVSDVVLQFGDTLLMEGRRKRLQKFYSSQDFIVLDKVKKTNLRLGKMLLSIIIVVEVITLAALNLLPLVVSALLGAVTLIVTNCVSTRYIYRNMDWRVIMLLAGIIPLGVAVEKTGLGAVLAQQIIEICGNGNPTAIVAGLFLFTTLLTSFMSNNATAVLIAPIAISLAHEIGMDAKPFLLTVMLAASTSFLTPIGYQTNTLVYGAGQYKFIDFLKVGGILTILVWLSSTVMISWWYFN